ncbi:magnesium chelatase domain-containing protein, partial [Acinetobacter baumannii]|uniref:magnesium chelatase domain-containing protein n=1 Tax=Acinetobacter baumannii TaxID=470 RepID=UPI0031F45685
QAGVDGQGYGQVRCRFGQAQAVYSSLRDISMDSRTVVMGEVGLTGDIRRVPQALRRVKEAAKMGFNTF